MQKTYWNSTIKIRKTKKRLKQSVKLAKTKELTLKSYLPTLRKQDKENSRPFLIKRLDKIVSDITLKDGICKRCGKRHYQYENKKDEMKWHNFGTSHYWARDYFGVRWDLDNLDGLCWLPCHKQKWEHDKQGAYKDYMIKKLGQDGFDRLEIKARSIAKFSTSDLKLLVMDFERRKEVK